MAEPAPTVIMFRKELLPYSETFIAAQARALRKYHPLLVGYRENPSGAHYLTGCDRALLSEHAWFPALAKARLKLTGRVPSRWLATMRAARPTLLHAHFGTSITPARPIADALHIPLLVTFHGYDIAKRSAGPAAARRRAQALQNVDHAIAVSRFIADRLLEAGCPEQRITVHRIGVDTDAFKPPAEAPVPGRVLFVGRLTEKKGLVHLIRAFPAVQTRVDSAELVVAGDGPPRDAMQQLARDVGARVRFLGVQPPDAVAALLRSAAVLAAPSVVTASGDAEGLPITIMEALATGVPVVAFPSGGNTEGVRDGETGRLLPAGDERALADALADILLDGNLRARMSAASRVLALEEFSLARQTALLEAIYDRVRAGHVAGARLRGSQTPA